LRRRNKLRRRGTVVPTGAVPGAIGWLSMAERDLRQIIDPDWAAALEPVAGRITAMGDFLREEIAAGRRYLPAGENVLRAFQQPLGAVRVLTVRPGQPGSHRGLGWEEVTDQAIRALAARQAPDSSGRAPLVAILWGRDARSLAPLLDGVPLIESAHPSPNSADRGFFESRPFSRANKLLEQQGAAPIDWKLP
jgi:uracil DNA glycosylase